jgi:hypothetical protein
VSSGEHLVEYRSTDNAGNVESIKSCTVTIIQARRCVYSPVVARSPA